MSQTLEAGASPHAAPPRPRPPAAPGLVTLTSIPREVDASWWRTHAHLVHDRDGGEVLRFQPGAALEVSEPDATPMGDGDADFAGLVGQERLVANLRDVAEGARALHRAFPHVLLAGPERTHKTTLARLIAAASAKPLAEVSLPRSFDRSAAIRLLTSLAEGTVLFVDEAQALPLPFLAVLLEALAHGQLALELSDGTRTSRLTLRLPAFTLVAATPDEWAIPAALRPCFGLRETLLHEHREVPAQPARPAASAPAVKTTRGAARVPARAARGTPKEALGRRARAPRACAGDGTGRLDLERSTRALAGPGCDASGREPREPRYLGVLRASPTPLPLAPLARVPERTPRTLDEHMEPGLFERGVVRWTLRGRLTTPRQHPPASVYVSPGVHAAPNVRRDIPPTLSTP